MRQGEALRAAGRAEVRLPVFYFTQLLGLAMGLSARRLGLRRMLVEPFSLLLRKGTVTEGVGVGR
jgi:heterodisulfide reductase subunit B